MDTLRGVRLRMLAAWLLDSILPHSALDQVRNTIVTSATAVLDERRRRWKSRIYPLHHAYNRVE